MYNDTNLAIKSESKNPVFISLKEIFEKENGRQSELISIIQGKLHNILNKRIPEKEELPVMPVENDFNSAIGNQLNQLRRNGDKLEQIINHFESIL